MLATHALHDVAWVYISADVDRGVEAGGLARARAIDVVLVLERRRTAERDTERVDLRSRRGAERAFERAAGNGDVLEVALVERDAL